MRGYTPSIIIPVLGLLLGACGGDDGGEPRDLHTPHRFESAAELLDFGTGEHQPTQVKFVLTTFDGPTSRASFLDPAFYTFHDEWYWFRMLNGVPIPGIDVEPESGSTFETVEAAYEAYQGQSDGLPLGLKWTAEGKRLYSPAFYEYALGKDHTGGDQRSFGVGSIVHYEANSGRVMPEELWLFELEYTDTPDEALIAKFMERLKVGLPKDVGESLRWLARPSLQQQALAVALRAGGGPLADKVVTYTDLVVADAVEVYNPGLICGRLKMFEAGELGGASVGPEDIVITADVPDYLPPVAAIVTAVPQTPLAHLNLLAKARGTPNAHVGDVALDPTLKTWAYYHTPVILEVTSDGVRWAPITEAEYSTYRAKLGSVAMTIEQVDLSAAPSLVDLPQADSEALAGLVPLIGGKSAGFLALQNVASVTVPTQPLALTIRPYAEHLAPLRGQVEALLADEAFLDDGRVRFLALEGEEEFEEQHSGDASALAWLEKTLDTLSSSSPVGAIVAAGGLKAMLRARPLDVGFAAELTEALTARYGLFAVTQGLRFRSSSTAEDVPGFNGAGLYDSNTGFLYPAEQSQEKDQKRSVEWALKKTWASYWTFEAFEERRAAGIDHLSGNMGVLVHPRFDDPKELANGVITFSLALKGGTADVREMVLNVQDGALSVTNPVPGNPAKPEIDRVLRLASGALHAERAQASSEVEAGVWVLTEDELAVLFEQTEEISEKWLARTNASRPKEERSTTLVLDFEFKKMASGWPALSDGSAAPGGLILKQVRSLEQKASLTSADLDGAIVPRDLLAVAVSAQKRVCTAEGLTFRTVEVFTSQSAAPLLDYSKLPFAAWISVELDVEAPGFGLEAGAPAKATHADLASLTRPQPDAWSLQAVLLPEAAELLGFTGVVFDGEGAWSLSNGESQLSGAGATCEVDDLVVGASDYLAGLLAVAETH